MPKPLSASAATHAFEAVVQGLAKQHLRHPFRSRFGTGELFEPLTFVKGHVLAPMEKPLANLLHELPERLAVMRVVRRDGVLYGLSLEAPATATVSELISMEEIEQAFVIQGRKARLLGYFDPTESRMIVAREVTELEPEKKTKKRVRPAKAKSLSRKVPRSKHGVRR